MWLYENNELNEIPVGSVGFVYEITNKVNGKKYIGKKNFYFARTKMVKGKRKKIKVDSDWKTYYGSNKTLNEDVLKYGVDSFIRVILKICKSKSEFAYFEAKYQFDNDVLIRDDYYNDWISVRLTRRHLKSLII
jgi:hypothetical protein